LADSLASAPEQRIQWKTGAFLARTRQGRDSQLVSTERSPATLARETRRDVLGEAALFGEAVGPLGGGWSLTLGGRLFATRSEASSRAVSGATSSPFRGRQSYVGFAPKLVLSYAPGLGMLVYAQASEGYRAGGFNTAILPGQAFDGINGQPQRRYFGDELWNFELGAKSTLLDGRLRLRAAAFQARWRNIQSDQLLQSGLPYTANLGDGVNLGVEFEGGYVAGGLRLDASFLLNNPELETVSPGFPGRQDFGLAGVPKVAASIAGSYDGRLSASWGWGADLRVAYVGRSRLALDAATAPTMGDYTTVRAAVRAQSDRLTLRLAADNLLGSKGDTFAYGNPFSLRLSPQSTPQRPRTITLELRARY
jgi:outer membrane receptor protein involved in Fe transport